MKTLRKITDLEKGSLFVNGTGDVKYLEFSQQDEKMKKLPAIEGREEKKAKSPKETPAS